MNVLTKYCYNIVLFSYKHKLFCCIAVALLLIINLDFCIGAGTCPTPVCTYNPASGASVTVSSGETACISGVYSSGTITLNGGTLLIKAGGGPVNVANVAFGAATTAITAATNTSPIQVTSAGHGFVTGQIVYITGCLGNTGANGTFTATVIDANNFTLGGSTTGGAWTSGGTVGYVSTVSNCATITGTWPLDNRRIINNYADNAIAIDFNAAGGTLNNYGSPPSFGITNWNSAGTIINEAGGVITLTNLSVPAGSTIRNSSNAAAPSFTWGGNGTMTFAAGSATNVTNITNDASCTMSYTSGGNAFNLNDYCILTNNGTFIDAGNFLEEVGTHAQIINGVHASMSVTGPTAMFRTNGNLFINKGTLTTVDMTVQGANTVVQMYEASRINVTGTFLNSWDNAFSYLGGSYSCGYINNSGGAGAVAFVITNAAADKIYWCGPSTTNTTGTTYTVTNATNANPIVITTSAAHGFVTDQRVIVAGVLGVGAANTQATITVLSATTFSMNGVNGTGTPYSSGGTAVSTKLGTLAYKGSAGCTAPICAGLPIELISFNAKAKGDFVEIIWTSASEINNDFFTIERSIDGIHFEIIVILKGAGNSIQNLNYKTFDFKPSPGVSYYRLKQTDFDGKFEYFDPVAVYFSGSENNDWIVYPNPAHGDQLYIKFLNKAMKNKIADVTIFDVIGQTVFEKHLKNDFEQPQNLLDISPSLSKGIYIVKVTCDYKFKCTKLIVD